MRCLVAGCLLFTSLLLIQPVTAEDGLPAITEGNKVRIEYDTTVTKRLLLFIHYTENETRNFTGQLVSATRDSITVADPVSGHGFHQHATDDVKKLYVSSGKRRAAWRGVVIGAGTGAVLGVLSAGPTAFSNNGIEWNERRTPLEIAAILTVGGAVLGGIIGSLFKQDRWQEVDRQHWPGQVQLGITPVSQTVNLSVKF